MQLGGGTILDIYDSQGDFMSKALFIILFFLSLPSFAIELIPYEIDSTEIVHCQSGVELNGKEPSLGSIFPWGKKESGFDSFIVALNNDGKTIYRFGNTKGLSFETREEMALALEKLIQRGICPDSSEL